LGGVDEIVGGGKEKSSARRGVRCVEEGVGTHRVAGCELLLCADDGSAALGGVEGALASHDCLSGYAAAAGLAANLGDAVPVV